jgi:hypothetical protein
VFAFWNPDFSAIDKKMVAHEHRLVAITIDSLNRYF